MKWAYITKDKTTEHAYYLWWLSGRALKPRIGILLYILRALYTLRRKQQSARLESDYCTDAASSDWAAFVWENLDNL